MFIKTFLTSKTKHKKLSPADSIREPRAIGASSVAYSDFSLTGLNAGDNFYLNFKEVLRRALERNVSEAPKD